MPKMVIALCGLGRQKCPPRLWWVVIALLLCLCDTRVRGTAKDFFCRDFNECHRCTDHIDCGWCRTTGTCEGGDTKGGLECAEWASRTCGDAHFELR